MKRPIGIRCGSRRRKHKKWRILEHRTAKEGNEVRLAAEGRPRPWTSYSLIPNFSIAIFAASPCPHLFSRSDYALFCLYFAFNPRSCSYGCFWCFVLLALFCFSIFEFRSWNLETLKSPSLCGFYLLFLEFVVWPVDFNESFG